MPDEDLSSWLDKEAESESGDLAAWLDAEARSEPANAGPGSNGQPSWAGRQLSRFGRGMAREALNQPANAAGALAAGATLAEDIAGVVAPAPVRRAVGAAAEAARGYERFMTTATDMAQVGLGVPRPDGSTAEALGSGATQMGLALPAGALGVFGTAGRAVAFGLASGAQQAGGTYREARAELGDGGESRAALEGTVAGGITAVTSFFPGAKILERAPGGKQLLAEAAKRAASRVGEAAVAEGLQEVAEGIGQDIATELIRRDGSLSMDDAARILSDPKRAQEFIVGGALGGAARGAVEGLQAATAKAPSGAAQAPSEAPQAPSSPDGASPPPPPPVPSQDPAEPPEGGLFPPQPKRPERPQTPPEGLQPPLPPEPVPQPPEPAPTPPTRPEPEPVTPSPEPEQNTEPTPVAPEPPRVTPRDTWPERPPVAVEPARGRAGSIVLPGNRQLEAEYAVVEADDLIPTHDPRNGFAPNPAGDVNERPYQDADAGAPSRKTVHGIADAINPDLLLTDTPTAVDGPPITTGDFRVVGGNARAMGIQLAYSGDGAKAAKYREALVERAAALGIDPARVEGMKAPVLVRAIRGDAGRPGELSRVLNEPLTTGRTREADAVSRAQRITPEVASAITGAIGDRTIAEALGDGKTATSIVRELVGAGAVSEREIPSLVVGGEVTPEAKVMIENVLVGSLVPDVRTLTELAPSTRQALVRGLSPMLRLLRATRAPEAGIDFRTVLDNALSAIAAKRQTGARSIDDLVSQTSMIAEPWREDARGIALARLLDESKPTAWGKKIAGIAEAVEEAAGGQIPLGRDKAPTIAEAFDGEIGLGPAAALFSTRPGGTALNVGPAFRGPRIQPAPIAGRTPKRISQMVIDLSAAARRRVRVGDTSGPHALGTYYPGNAKTIIRYTGDLDVAAHEIGHSLDDLYGILRNATPAELQAIDAELFKPQFQTTTIPQYPHHIKRAEAVTEWIRAWMINPARARAEAPVFSSRFDKVVDAETRAKLAAFGEDVRAWYGADPETRTLANIQMHDEAPGVVKRALAMLKGQQYGSFRITLADRLYRNAVDAFWPLWKAVDAARSLRGVLSVAPSQDPQTLVRGLTAFDSKFEAIVRNGPIDEDNKPLPGVGGIQWLLEPLNSEDVESLDRDMGGAVALMVSERVIERAMRLDDAVRQVETLQLNATQIAAQIRSAPPGSVVMVGNKTAQQAIRDIFEQIRATMKSWGYSGSIKGFRGWVAERKERMSGVGGGFFNDTRQAMETYAAIRQDPQRYARLKEAANRYRTWADAVLAYAVAKGRMSPQQAAAIKARNQHYVAMQRWDSNDENTPQFFLDARGAVGTAREFIKRFSGSTRTIANPYVSLLMNTYATIRETDRNAAMLALVSELKNFRGLYQGDVVDLDQIGSEATENDKDTVRYFVNGEPRYWKFETNLHNALKGIGEAEQLRGVLRLFVRMVRFTRNLTVYSPKFVARQLVRDPINRAIMSRHGSKPWDHMFLPWGRSLERFRQDMDEMRLYGGAMFGHYAPGRRAYYGMLDEAVRRVVKEKPGIGRTILSSPARLVHAWIRFSEATENAGRVAEYRRARQTYLAKGLRDADARLAAAADTRALVDYARMGSQVRSLNQWVMFLNAAIQSLDATARRAKEAPVRTAVRWGVWTVAPTLMAMSWNAMMGADDEERQLPPWRRAMFWNLKLGDGWITIPKPYEFGVAATIVQVGADRAMGHDVYAKDVLSMLAPVLPAGPDDMLGPLKPIVEIATGYNFFTGRSIIPDWERDLPVAEREGASRASRIGKAVQAASLATGLESLAIDARQVDALIEGFGSGVGRLAMSASDVGRADREFRPLESLTGVVASPNPGSESDVRAAFDMMRERQMTGTRAYKALRQQLEAYWAAETTDEKRRIAQELRDYAKALRSELQSAPKEEAAGARP